MIDTLSRAYILLGVEMPEAGKIHTEEEFRDVLGIREHAASYLVHKLGVNGLISQNSEQELLDIYFALKEAIIDGNTRSLKKVTGNEGETTPGMEKAMEEAARKGQFNPENQSGGGRRELSEEDLVETIKEFFNEQNVHSRDFRDYPALASAAKALARKILEG